MRPLVVGFDLDMTLIDTRPGIAAVWEALAAETGVPIDSAAAVSRLGPPLEDELAVWFPADQWAEAGDRFRALYPSLAVAPTAVLPGAHEAMAAVRRHGGSVVVVTGKYAPNARLHLEHTGLEVDHLVGWLWGPGKATALLEHGASVYVGDHVGDVEGARAAGAVSVAVPTGPVSAEDLRAAGADVVLADLAEFPAWLDGFVQRRRLADLDERLRGLGSVLVAFSGGADSAFLLAAAVRALGADRVVAATAVAPACPRRARRGGPASRRPSACGTVRRRPTRWAARATGPTPGTGATSARPSCWTCSGRWPPSRASRRGHRHQRRRRRGRLPAGHPGGRRARGGHAAARRGADQGGGPRRQPATGPGHVGQAGGGLPVQPGRVRRCASRRRGWPGSSGRRRRCARRWRTPGSRSATCGCATWATRRGSRSTPRRSPAVAACAAVADAVRAAGFATGRGRPARVPVRFDERAAAGPGALPLTGDRQTPGVP